MRCLLDEMFTLDVRHYVATLLHPKYRSLNMCSEKERKECHSYVRQQLRSIHIEPDETNQQQPIKPSIKKFKGDFFSRFESNDFERGEASEEESENETEEFSSRGKKSRRT